MVYNRGVQAIARVLLPPAAQRGCPPSKREASAAFPVDRAISLAEILYDIACKDAKTPATLFEGGCRRSDRGE